MSTVFEKIISPITKKNFFDNYFTKKHLYIKGNKDKFDNLFNIDSFNNILDNSDVFKFFLALDSKIIHTRELEKEEIKDFLLKGYTIKMNYVEYLNKELANFTNSLKKEFLSDVKINLYASYPDKGAFPPHIDNYDIFIIHIYGKKQWFVADILETDLLIEKNMLVSNNIAPWDKWTSEKPYSVSEKFFNKNREMFKSYILEAGDVLYMPKGFIHKVHPIEETLHLTVGFSTMSGIDYFLKFSSLLSVFLEKINIPIFNKNNNISFAEDINNISPFIKESIDKLDTKELMKYFDRKWILGIENSDTIQLPYNYFPFETKFENRVLKANTELFSISKYNKKVEIFISNQSFSLNENYEQIIRFILNRKSFTFIELSKEFNFVEPQSLLDLLYYLIKNSIIIYDK